MIAAVEPELFLGDTTLGPHFAKDRCKSLLWREALPAMALHLLLMLGYLHSIVLQSILLHIILFESRNDSNLDRNEGISQETEHGCNSPER